MVKQPVVGVRFELAVQPRQRFRLLELAREARLALLWLQGASGSLRAQPTRQRGARHLEEALHLHAGRAVANRRHGSLPQIYRVKPSHPYNLAGFTYLESCCKPLLLQNQTMPWTYWCQGERSLIILALGPLRSSTV